VVQLRASSNAEAQRCIYRHVHELSRHAGVSAGAGGFTKSCCPNPHANGIILICPAVAAPASQPNMHLHVWMYAEATCGSCISGGCAQLAAGVVAPVMARPLCTCIYLVVLCVALASNEECLALSLVVYRRYLSAEHQSHDEHTVTTRTVW
jgi:hypothetical protein